MREHLEEEEEKRMLFVMSIYSVILCILLIVFSWNVEDKRQILIIGMVVVGYLLIRRNFSPLVVCSGIMCRALGLL